MSNVKFKPCPFCGNTKLEVTPESTFYVLQGRYGTAAVDVRCEGCKTDMWEHSREEKDYDKRVQMLVRKWNRRVGNG